MSEVPDRLRVGRGVRALAATTVLLVLAPIVENFRAEPRDGFPLSYYPMFTTVRNGRTNVYHAIGVRADGSSIDLHYRLAAAGGMNQVRRQMRLLARDGRADSLADTIAENARRRGLLEAEKLVAIEIVRDTYEFDRFFGGDRERPAGRRHYHRLELGEEQER